MGAQCKMTVKVVDDDGKPVEGAQVWIKIRSDAWGKSDKNGLFSYTSAFYEIGKGHAEKEGYYEARSADVYFKADNSGRGQPWNPVQEIQLKKIIKPHPMRIGWIPNIPVLDKPCGFDFLMGDWTAPYGHGKTDDVLLMVSGWYDTNNGTRHGTIQ